MRTPAAAILCLAAILGTAWPVPGMTANAPPPSIGVSPSRLEISVEGNTTMGSATVLNMSERDIHVKASVTGFDLDEANNFRELPPAPGTLPNAIMINPVEFTIPANGSQTVRFAISRHRLEGDGEHRAMLFFSELVDTDQAGVKLNFRLGMPIYASVGETEPVAVLNGLKFDASEHRIELDVTSVGNAQVKPAGFYLWWPVLDFPKEKRALREVAALAGNPRKELPGHTAGGPLVTKPFGSGESRAAAGPRGVHAGRAHGGGRSVHRAGHRVRTLTDDDRGHGVAGHSSGWQGRHTA